MGFLTLMRRQNVLRLMWTQLELTIEQGHVTGGELRLPGTATKNKKPLAVPLTGRLLALIERRWQGRLEASPYVFHRHGRPLVWFRSTWQEATQAIGMPGFLFHDLRRSGARPLIRAGVPEDMVMKMGGWRTRSMLTRYNIVDTPTSPTPRRRWTPSSPPRAPGRWSPSGARRPSGLASTVHEIVHEPGTTRDTQDHSGPPPTLDIPAPCALVFAYAEGSNTSAAGLRISIPVLAPGMCRSIR